MCINFLKHSSYNISFSLLVFMTNNCTCLLCDFNCVIRRIIIIHINYRIGQLTPKIRYYFFNGFTLIIARNQYCNLIHSILLYPAFICAVFIYHIFPHTLLLFLCCCFQSQTLLNFNYSSNSARCISQLSI